MPIKLMTLAILIFAIAACGTAATAPPNEAELTASSNDVLGNETRMKDERVLEVAMTFLDEPPDPYQAGWLAVPTGLAETLIKKDENLNPAPWLATVEIQVDPAVREIS